MVTELLPEQILPKLILVHCATCTCLSTKRLRNFYDFFHFLLLALAYMYLPSTLYVPSSEFSVFQDCPWAIFFLFIFKDNKAPWKWVGFVRWKWRNAQQGFHATLGSFNNHVDISLPFLTNYLPPQGYFWSLDFLEAIQGITLMSIGISLCHLLNFSVFRHVFISSLDMFKNCINLYHIDSEQV